jgi:undecaprenyl-diphosphatase
MPYSWDLTLLHAINRGWSHPALDWLMPAVSAIDAWLPLLIVVAVVVALRGGRKARVMLACLAVTLALCDGVVCNALKKAVGRVRPRDAMEGVVVRDLGAGSPNFVRLFKAPAMTMSRPRGEERGKSFPSSHTANLFAAATVMAFFYRRWSLGIYGLAVLVALSRIYVGAHWPSDIPPSAAVGVLVALGVVWGFRRWVPAKLHRPNP